MFCLSALLAPFALVSVVRAQAPEVVLEEGDVLLSAGHRVTNIGWSELDDRGEWFALAAYQEPAPGGTVLFLASSRGELEADGAVAQFDRFAVTPRGDLAQIVTRSSSPDVVELLWNGVPIAASGETAAGEGIPLDATFEAFDDLRVNGRNQILVRARLSTGTALLRFRLDDAGAVSSVRSVLPLGVSPGLPPTLPASAIALNERGDWMASVHSDLLPPGGAILMNSQIVALAGAPAPVAGRTYTELGDSPLDLDDLGHFVYAARIDGSLDNELLVRDGSVLFRSGDVLPALAPDRIVRLVSHPVCLSNSGDVYWFADLGGRGAACMRNGRVIVRSGVSVVGGRRVSSVSDAFALSPKGRFWSGTVVLAGPTSLEDALLLADFGLAEPIAGCASNPASLALASGFVLAGQTIVLETRGDAPAGAVSFLCLAERRVTNPDGCGFRLPFGEGMLDLSGRSFLQQGPLFDGSSARFSLAIPDSLALVDGEFFAQAFLSDPSAVPLGSGIQLSNALRLEIGAP
jgi:hypothetical protein